MANPAESKLRIISDIPGFTEDVRVARVASPIITPREYKVEAIKFDAQYHPDRLTLKQKVELVDSSGRTIGGAMIWEATWVKKTDDSALQAVRDLMGSQFEQEQLEHPEAYS